MIFVLVLLWLSVVVRQLSAMSIVGCHTVSALVQSKVCGSRRKPTGRSTGQRCSSRLAPALATVTLLSSG